MHVYKQSFPSKFAMNGLNRETYLPVDLLTGEQQFFNL